MSGNGGKVILHLIPDDDGPQRIVTELLNAVPAGSYLALSHVASDINAEAMAEMAKRLNSLLAQKGTYRSRAEVSRLFGGLEVAEPGVVPIPQWRPGSEAEATAAAAMWGGVGRKK